MDWATAQTVTVAATDDDVAEANETVTLAHAVASTDDAAYNALSDVNVTVTVTDNDSVGVSIDPTSLTVVEGSSVDYAVKLGSQPAGDVVVTVSGQAGSGVALSGTSLSADDELTFTSVDWATAQTVTVAATDDDVAEANETVTLAHAVASTDDAAYNALSDVNVTVTVTDNDSVQDAVVPLDWALKPSDLSGGDQFRLLFTTHTGSRAPNSTDIGDYNTYVQSQANAGHQAIRPYSSGFRVVGSTATVDAINNTSTEWTNTNTGVPIYWLNGNKVADDYEDFYSSSWDDEANPTRRGGDVKFPGDGVVLTGSNNDGTAKSPFGGARVEIGRLNGVGNPFTAGATLSNTNIGTPYYALSEVFTVTDNDSVGVSIDPTSLTVVEGSSVDYAVELTSEPAGDVVVTVSGQAGSGVTLSGTSLSADDELTFTSADWATAQTVTVAATDDDVAEANETVTLAHAVASTDDAAYNALSDRRDGDRHRQRFGGGEHRPHVVDGG